MGIRMKGLQSIFPQHPPIDSLIGEFIFKSSPNHTQEEILVWKKMIANIVISFRKYSKFIYPPFKEGFYSLELDSLSIPNLDIINQKRT